MTTLEFRMPKVGDKVFTRFGSIGTIEAIAKPIRGERGYEYNGRFYFHPYIVRLSLSHTLESMAYDEIRLA